MGIDVGVGKGYNWGDLMAGRGYSGGRDPFLRPCAVLEARVLLGRV